jgi:beta-glucosidase-like glycosyl hydrolase
MTDFSSLFPRIAATLTPRQKAAQCVVVRVSADEYYSDDADAQRHYRKTLRTLIRDEGIGGVCVFQGDAVQTASMLAELQTIATHSAAYAATRLPLLVAADFENGVGMRLRGGTVFAHAANMGSGADTAMTERIARAIAAEARTLGIHWNFAPVGDVHSAPANPVIGNRAFGTSAETVSPQVLAFVRGLQGESENENENEGVDMSDNRADAASQRMLACVKHFPGHGATTTDSHVSLPVLNIVEKNSQNKNQGSAEDNGTVRAEGIEKKLFYERDLKPFRDAIAAGVRSVMVGHIAVPALEPVLEIPASAVAAPRPASLSRAIMHTLLRTELGFEGLIVTDALDMRAVAEYLANDLADAALDAHTLSAEAARQAFAAGADVVLLPPDAEAAIAGILAAVDEEAHVDASRLDASLRRILEAKVWCGLQGKDEHEHENDKKTLAVTPESIKQHQLMALDAAKAGLRWHAPSALPSALSTLLSGLLPTLLPIARWRQVAAFALVEEEQSASFAASFEAATTFFRYLGQAFQGDCDFGYIDAAMSDDDLRSFADATHEAELLIFAVFARPQQGATFDATSMAGAMAGASVALAPRLESIAQTLLRSSLDSPLDSSPRAARPAIAIFFGNPALATTFLADTSSAPFAPSSIAHLCTYSSADPALGAAASALLEEYS